MYAISIPIHHPNYTSIFQKHIMNVGQCLPRHCTPDDVKIILNMDASARKFNANYVNASTDANKGEINVFNVRRIPGDYNVWKDGSFYLVS